MQLPVYICFWEIQWFQVTISQHTNTLKTSPNFPVHLGLIHKALVHEKIQTHSKKKPLRGPVKQLKLLLAQRFCFLIALLMLHATNYTDLERFRRDYRKGFLAELLSRLSLCIGLGDCINSCVNYSQTYLKASPVALDTYLCTGI